jgi:mannose-1-phosphate guanylyltransferase
MKPKSLRTDRFVVILAGGRGERFWPLSRERAPKQLLALLGSRSLLQQAVDRVLPLAPPENLFVITNAAQRRAVCRQLPGLPKENVIGEPCGRDTCAAVTLAAALTGARSAAAVMAVLPADHVIPEPKKIQRVLADALDLAGRERVIVTIGIRPTEPATGYGYIRVGAPLPPPPGCRPWQTAFFRAEKFVEKPPYDKAVEYLNSGAYRWNGGMFVWSFATITEGLAQHAPDMAEAGARWLRAASSARLHELLAADYASLRKTSIDFALLEHARNVVVADGDFAWDDLGSWTALGRHLPLDASGNCSRGAWAQVDSERNIIFDARTSQRNLTALVGVRDCIVVHTDDATLVAHKSQAQKVKDLVVRLAASAEHRRLV